MRLAAIASPKRFVGQDQLLVHGHLRNRQEEPFALADKGGILAAVAGLDLESLASLAGLDLGGLESFLGLADGADRGGFGDAGDEPVPLVVAAQELALVPAFTDQEEQVAVGGLHVEDSDLGLGPRRADDLEELTFAVALHVEGDDARRAAAARRTISDLQPSANAGELRVEQVRVHDRGDTIQAQGVRSGSGSFKKWATA